MMHAFRAFAKTWVAKVLLAVLAVSFVVWGANSQIDMNFSKSVVRAGSHKVGDAEFKGFFDNALKSASQQQGRPVTAQDAVKQGAVDIILEQLAQANALWETAFRLGVRPSDKMVARQIAKMEGFADPITRQFSERLYLERLAEVGLTDVQAERQFRDEIAESHLASGLGAGLTTPKVYAAVLATLSLEERSVAYFGVDPRMAGSVPPPTDAQLTAFIKETADQWRRPEIRNISLVRFSAAALTPTMAVDEAALRKQFDARKASYTTAEKRSFVQIALRSPGEAQVVGDRLAKGEDPMVVARSVGAQAIPYANVEKGAVADPAVGQAAFGLKPGGVAPVRSAVGPALVKVTAVTPGKQASFEEARPQLEQQLREAAAQEKVYADVAKYGDAHDAGATLPQAAQAVGATVYALGPMSAQGIDQFGRPVTGLTERMLKDAFATPQGGETELIDIGKAEYYALRVDKVTPAALPSLAEVRGPAVQRYMQRETIRRMQARADELAARVRAGEPIETVAASAGAQVKRVDAISRVTVGQYRDLGQPFLGRLFQAKANETFTAQGPGIAISVARATAIKPGNPGFAAAVIQGGQREMNRELLTEVGQQVRDAARRKVKPKVDRARAFKVIGVEPADVPGAPPASGAPAAAAP